MKIANTSLEMASSRIATQNLEVRESLRMWVGQARPDFEAGGNAPKLDPVQLSDAGKAAQQADATAEEALEHDPKMLLLRTLIEYFTGREIKLFDARELQAAIDETAAAGEAAQQQVARQSAPRPAGYGVEYDYHAAYSESETTTFVARGIVQTSDGKSIEFDLSLVMQRSYAEESNVSLRLGDAVRKKDPLVLNFGGTAAQLTDTRFKFDLDADGKTESINFVAGGSGFLAFDRNQDGKINNGLELFGPATDDGFAELARLDDDGNAWIDENDAAYDRLSVWTKDSGGKDVLRSLAEAKVGAIALSNLATAFDLKNATNQTLGQIRSSGIFLQEDGRVGTVQQIDLTV